MVRLKWRIQDHRVLSRLGLLRRRPLRVFTLEEHLSSARAVLREAYFAEGMPGTELSPHDFIIITRRDSCAVGTRSWSSDTWHFVRNSCLVQELLLGMRAERHLAVIKALLLDILIVCLVVSCSLRAAR